MHIQLKLISLLTLTVLPVALPAQNPGQRISVTVTIDSVSVRGDTIGVAAKVTNAPSSQESLWSYYVDEPSGIVAIRRPSAPAGTKWYQSTNYRGRPMATWDVLGTQLAPGNTGPQLYFESIGLPGILSYWAGGKFALPTDVDKPDELIVTDALTTEMVTGKTVGVNPWPIDRSAAGLLARLRTLTQSSCDTPLSWISDSNLCTQLLSDLDAAESYRASGQTSQAKGALTHYSGLLGTPTSYSTGVNSSAFWLLRVNADIINGML
jgi:hypothetical protein